MKPPTYFRSVSWTLLAAALSLSAYFATRDARLGLLPIAFIFGWAQSGSV
jgi:hypothetical protein